MEVLESPISKIFGGKIRSILRCTGSKDSVTLEPFQSLPLDITPDHVRSVEDALENMTVPEIMHDYISTKGIVTDATKQIFLETLPPVLVLHVKRFVYDNIGGVQKLQKHIRYDLELTIKSGKG
jgi:ubiquitin carboxyl-terminal hydrolase 10